MDIKVHKPLGNRPHLINQYSNVALHEAFVAKLKTFWVLIVFHVPKDTWT